VTKAYRTSLWGAAAALWLGAAPARGQPPPGGELPAALDRADARFVEGDLQGALEILEPVCAGSDGPECAFSLGAIHHGLGHCSDALVHYRRYRELAPQGEHRAEVDAALEEVESRCGQNAPAAASAAGGTAPAIASAPAALAASATSVPGLGSTVEAGPGATSPLASPPSSVSSQLIAGSFVLSGAAAVSSVVFGVLAARSAAHCDRARAYDSAFIDECEERGPAYQGLWQGFAVASGAFLGIGLTIWWLDADRSASVAMTSAGSPLLRYQGRF
jgi:hypothetical protein